MAGAEAEAAAEAAAEAEAEAEAEAKAEAEAEAAAARERERAPPPKRALRAEGASRSSRRAGAFVRLAGHQLKESRRRAASGGAAQRTGRRRVDGGTRSLRAVDEEAELPATPRRMEEWPEAGGAHVDI